MVIRIEKLNLALEKGLLPADAPERMFMDVGFAPEKVSALLFALEGKNRRPPAPLEIRAELSRAERTLGTMLPTSQLVKMGTKGREGIHRMLLEHLPRRLRSEAFLQEAAPLVASPLKVGKATDEVEAKILDLVAKHKLMCRSFPVLAILSCLYDNLPDAPAGGQYRPGRAVIKPGPVYGADRAYNAMSDLFALELLVNSYGVLQDSEAVFFTEEVGLTAFWTALDVRDIQGASASSTTARSMATLTITQGLTPALDDAQREALKDRLLLRDGVAPISAQK